MDIATLVSALAPAFAAGFALQRLLEILDPILDKIGKGERKKIVLGLVSFVSGLGLASWEGIRVLTNLKVSQGDVWFLDYLVTALILSGGTEGFNSIVKFLNYKKEETKQEADTKEVTATATRALFQRRLRNTAMSATLSGLESSGDLHTDLTSALKDEIRNRFPDQFKDAGWEKRSFDAYVDAETLFKILDAVRAATEWVATAYGVRLTELAMQQLQSKVKTSTTPEGIVKEMSKKVEAAGPLTN